MRTSTRSWDAVVFCVCRFRFAIRARGNTSTATRRMGSLRTAVSIGVARYLNNHIGAANHAQSQHMAELILTISTGITTPATPAKREKYGGFHSSRRSSASPAFRNIRHNSRVAPYARGAWSRGPRHMYFLASRAFKSPGAEVPRRRVVSRFSRLAIPSSAREQSWHHCRSCQSCQEHPIARARRSSVCSEDAEAACPFASSAIA